MPFQRERGHGEQQEHVSEPDALKQDYPADLRDMILADQPGDVPGAVRMPAPSPQAPGVPPAQVVVTQVRGRSAVTQEPTYVPLDERWHQQQVPQPETAQPPPAKRPSRPTSAPQPARAAAAVVQPPKPRITMVTPPLAPEEWDERYSEDGDDDDLTAADLRVHTPLSRIGTTIFYIALLYATWLIWKTGARYSIDALNNAAPFLKRFGPDVASWNTTPFFVTNGLGTLLSYVPFMGGIGSTIAKMPAIWATPILISIGEAVFWPRRKRLTKDLLLFWRPLKGEPSWKHYVFLFILGYDVLSTCAGAIIDMVAPQSAFTWSYLWNASPDAILSGFALGVFCAVTSERLSSFVLREIVGLWVPPTSRIHSWFRPVAYVQYA